MKNGGFDQVKNFLFLVMVAILDIIQTNRIEFRTGMIQGLFLPNLVKIGRVILDNNIFSHNRQMCNVDCKTPPNIYTKTPPYIYII